MGTRPFFTIDPLFIKPLAYPGGLLFSCPWEGGQLSFRSFDLDQDLDLIHRWVHMAYSQAFWPLPLDRDSLHALYYNIQRNSHGHSFLGLWNETPVCQLDVYRVEIDEIDQYVQAGPQDAGFHLLMAPNERPRPGLTTAVLTRFFSYYFRFPQAGTLYAEPDIRNERSNLLLRRLGFHFHGQILMSYKTANLYSLTKTAFHAKHPHGLF